MSLYQLKPKFQQLLRPVVGKLAKLGVTANMVTLIAALCSIILGGCLCFWGSQYPLLFLTLPIWLFLRMALNAIDGMLAREHNQKSKLGAYFNELGDVVSDSALVLPFAFLGPVNPLLVYGVIFLALITEFTGVLGCLVGAERQYNGPSGKADRALFFGAIGLYFALTGTLPAWISCAFGVLAIALTWTTVNRIRAGLNAESPVETTVISVTQQS